MNNKRNLGVILLSALAFSTFSSVPKVTEARLEGFTAAELSSSQTIVVDGKKDTIYGATTKINIDTIRKQYLFNNAKSNPNPATGSISVMFNDSKLLYFIEAL